MILIFGGTTEGRICIDVCEEAHQTFFYSTKTDHQAVDLVFGKKVSGGMDAKEMITFCNDNQIRLIVDAAHPFAENLHNNIYVASKELKIPVVRYERDYPKRDGSLFWMESYKQAISFLEEYNLDQVLALSGVNTIAKLKPFWVKKKMWFRILNREDSIAVAKSQNYPLANLLYYESDNDNLEQFIQENRPRAIVTKESGESGGFSDKIRISKQYRIPLVVICRPKLSDTFINVFGPYGLRKQIEYYVPDFFQLKIGFTTGTCATAATKAAFLALLSQQKEEKVTVTLPSGEQIFIPCKVVALNAKLASAVVVKDAGDDPDVTHKKEIVSTVAINLEHKGVRFLQGDGVGRVTLPGLGLEIGGPAINKTPRMMMKREIFKVMRHYEDMLPRGFKTGVDVTISVPEGRELAQKTFNPKLGIVDGISIIGTSGVVKPFSSEAFIASIKREMQVAKALNCTEIVLNSGAKSERFLKSLFPNLPSNAFIHYGNFIGESIGAAESLSFEKLSMGVMLGKAVKLATGALDTHSKKVNMDIDFILEVAKEANCTSSELDQIPHLNLARELWGILGVDHQFFQLILKRCYAVCKPLFGGELSLYLITDEGVIISDKS